jgi:hypothetical protein
MLAQEPVVKSRRSEATSPVSSCQREDKGTCVTSQQRSFSGRDGGRRKRHLELEGARGRFARAIDPVGIRAPVQAEKVDAFRSPEAGPVLARDELLGRAFLQSPARSHRASDRQARR